MLDRVALGRGVDEAHAATCAKRGTRPAAFAASTRDAVIGGEPGEVGRRVGSARAGRSTGQSVPKTTWSTRRHLERRGQRGCVVGEPGVVPEPAEVRERPGRARSPASAGSRSRERGDPVREERRRSAEMPDLEPDAGTALERARVDEVRDRACRVEGELVEPHGMAREAAARAAGSRGGGRRRRLGGGARRTAGSHAASPTYVPATLERSIRRRARGCRERARARPARRRRPGAAAGRAPRTARAPPASARRGPRSRRAPARAPGRRSPRKAPGGPVETTAPSIPKRSMRLEEGVTRRRRQREGAAVGERQTGDVRVGEDVRMEVEAGHGSRCDDIEPWFGFLRGTASGRTAIACRAAVEEE